MCCTIVIVLLISIYCLLYYCFVVQSCTALFHSCYLCLAYGHILPLLGSLLEMQTRRSHPWSTESLHFTKLPRWLLCLFKFEKHCFHPQGLPHCAHAAQNNRPPRPWLLQAGLWSLPHSLFPGPWLVSLFEASLLIAGSDPPSVTLAFSSVLKQNADSSSIWFYHPGEQRQMGESKGAEKGEDQKPL